MKKYRVYGTVEVVVTKEVWANSEDEAIERASSELSCLTGYCGNGGDDKLIGVDEDGETVDAPNDIVYDDVEELEDDPNYFECPDCGEQCEACEADDGFTYWHCTNCDTYYDEDGDEFYPDVDDDEE